MIGVVDNAGRAILRIQLKHPTSATITDLETWIDTGFTGELVIPMQQIAALGLPLGPAVKAVLADGSQIKVDTYFCLVEWFGKWKNVEVVANQGRFPLLGVGLLLGHDLHIDYQAKTILLNWCPRCPRFMIPSG